ncbi:MAG: hypothetical protein ACFCVD_10765 [Nodosilinea sp.]
MMCLAAELPLPQTPPMVGLPQAAGWLGEHGYKLLPLVGLAL